MRKNEYRQEHHYTADERDRDRWCDNVAQHSVYYNMPRNEREKAARMFGPNWASILSGCGDQ